LQRQLVQALAGAAFRCAVVGQGEPRRDAGDQAAEAFEVGHAFVAAIPGRADFEGEVFFSVPAAMLVSTGSDIFCASAASCARASAPLAPVAAVVAAAALAPPRCRRLRRRRRVPG
jgi:hypothetical protein